MQRQRQQLRGGQDQLRHGRGHPLRLRGQLTAGARHALPPEAAPEALAQAWGSDEAPRPCWLLTSSSGPEASSRCARLPPRAPWCLQARRKSPSPHRPRTQPQESCGSVCVETVGVATLGPRAVSAPASPGSGQKAGALGPLPPTPTPAQGGPVPAAGGQAPGEGWTSDRKASGPCSPPWSGHLGCGRDLAPAGTPRARASGLGPKDTPRPPPRHLLPQCRQPHISGLGAGALGLHA